MFAVWSRNTVLTQYLVVMRQETIYTLTLNMSDCRDSCCVCPALLLKQRASLFDSSLNRRSCEGIQGSRKGDTDKAKNLFFIHRLYYFRHCKRFETYVVFTITDLFAKTHSTPVYMQFYARPDLSFCAHFFPVYMYDLPCLTVLTLFLSTCMT